MTAAPRSPEPSPWVRPVVLEGDRVRLEPLSVDHVAGLAAVGLDPAIWQWTLARPTDHEGVLAWVRQALANAEASQELPFATIEQSSGRVIGATRYLAIVPEHRRLEIGWTWVAPPWQRTGANREAKLLQLTHAFERLGARRVEFKTDSRNAASRAALLGMAQPSRASSAIT
jgi:RimJ/RimL family protein N-acetyltransferase